MSEFDNSIAVHPNPVWRDLSDFVIRAPIRPNGLAKSFEQLWARRQTSTTFEICCIPFFVYGLSLGDVVSTTDDGEFVFERIVVSSGRQVYRVWFGDSKYSQGEVEAQVAMRGGLVERSSANLISIDAADAEIGRSIASYLTALHGTGDLIFETATA